MIHTSLISFAYPKSKLLEFPPLKLNTGGNALIIGESGVGKTTFLHLLAGILTPNSGEVVIHNQNIFDLPLAKRDKFRGKHIGLVFQKSHFIHSLNLEDNLSYVQYFASGKSDKRRVGEVLGELGLREKAKENPLKLSQGQQQRANIAMAVLNQPEVILADEPTSSLDDKNCKVVLDLLLTEAKKNGSNLILITHDQRVKPYFQYVVEL